MKVLLLTEYGWPGEEIASLLASAENVSLTVVHRAMLDLNKHNLSRFDVVFTFGPHYGSMFTLMQGLKKCAEQGNLPKFIWWMNENIPGFNHPRLNSFLGKMRYFLDYLLSKLPLFLRKTPLAWIGHRYHIFHYLINGYKNGLIDTIVVTSDFKKERLQEMGIQCHYVPAGWGPSNNLGKLEHLKRDIDVLWLGRNHTFSLKRQRNIAKLEHDLKSRGINLLKITSGLNGEERTHVLNRSKILINLIRHKEDWTGHRLLLGSCNGAMIISEPMVDKKLFIHGEHIIFSPLSEFSNSIQHFLEQENERAQIAEKAHCFVHEQLTMRRCLERIFDCAGISLSYTRKPNTEMKKD